MVASGLEVALVVLVVLIGKWGFGWGVSHSAFTTIHIARQPPYIKYRTVTSNEEFESYRQSQIAMIKSRAVLDRALRNLKVAALPMVKECADPVEWLEKKIVVDSPDYPELIRISMNGADPAALVEIVNAVREAYLSAR